MRRAFLAALGALLISACAGMPSADAPVVSVVGVESLPGEGMELRLLLKLRVQNPSDAAIDYDGVSVRLEVQDRTFASGVSDAKGSVPRFGEAVIPVPVTVSMMNIVRQVVGAVNAGAPPEKIRYSLDGRLHGPGFRSHSFSARGDLALPASPPAANSPVAPTG